AFSDLVGRRMSAKAAARWEAELAAGGSRADLVTSVVSSRELHARLTGLLFELYLDRSPQADELAAWTTMLDAGATHLALETALLASPEYAPTDASFVARLYADVLDRAPEPAGRDYWIFQIGAGLPRGAVAGQFLRSEEATVLRSDQTSLAFFDRFVDLDADAALIADLRMTGDWPAQWATAVQSPEYERAERDDAGGGADEAGSALVEAIWGHRPGRPG
nr:DUF4214 domain-containing protein [Acidimicrobiia bacterium]